MDVKTVAAPIARSFHADNDDELSRYGIALVRPIGFERSQVFLVCLRVPAGAAMSGLKRDEAGPTSTVRTCIWPIASLTPCPAHAYCPGGFNVVQMAIGVRKRAASALPTVDELVNGMRSDGTVEKAIGEAGACGVVRVPVSLSENRSPTGQIAELGPCGPVWVTSRSRRLWV